MITRRRFIERLGLGVGATLLGPLAGGLFGEAMGQPATRKRVVIFIGGNGIHPRLLFTPPEIAALDPKLEAPVGGVKDYTWPAFLRGVEKYRHRMLLVDGLTNRHPWGHTAAYAALSGMPAANGDRNGNGGPAGGTTIDQFIAEKKATPFRSVLINVGGLAKSVFARGLERPQAAFTDVGQLYRVLFGMKTDPDGGPLRQRLLFDSIRADVRSVEGALAGPERQKLQDVLAAIEVLDQRAATLGKIACQPPAGPAPPSDDEQRLDHMVTLATIALLCGMTDVVGVSVGTGPSHSTFGAWHRAASEHGIPDKVDWAYIGHDAPDRYGRALTAFYDNIAGVMAKVADALDARKEADGSALDHTTMLLLSDNGDGHHSDHNRWPLAVLGGAGTIKADGRFIRYPLLGKPGHRALVDLYSSLAHAAGAPTDKFGEGGSEPVKGPLAEIM